ncbi:MAG: hypothetical protein AAF488_18090, partial [Planctomycetota bacterium]
WRVRFRLTPIADTENRQSITAQGIQTPWILYQDLRDLESGSALADREAEVQESFDSDRRELGAFACGRALSNAAQVLASLLNPSVPIDDENLFDFRSDAASWGPPANPGLLRGAVDSDDGATERFGSGHAVLVLENVPNDFFGPDVNICQQWIEFDTDRMEIVRRFLTDNGTPDPSDDGPFESLVDLANRCGEPTTNPGEEIHEFHLSSLTIRPGTQVRAVGSYPFVVRLSGLAEEDECDDPAFDRCPCEGDVISLPNCDGAPEPSARVCSGLHIDWDDTLIPATANNGLRDEGEFGWLRLDGQAGELLAFGAPLDPAPCVPATQGTPCVSTPPNSFNIQDGGRGGAGGTPGGNGGRLAVYPSDAQLLAQVEATAGGTGGGGWGGTPAAVDFDPEARVSSVSGAPGGGGGHRLRGGDGIYGSPAVAQYQLPRMGLGGLPHGTPNQFPLTAGRGGGGGGGSLTRVDACNGPYFTNDGAGGGGGGGAFAASIAGSAYVSGKITADGGDGGCTYTPNCCCIPCNYNSSVEQGAAGGGGSGGSILIRATLDIVTASCDSFSVLGGRGGRKFNANGREERTEHRGGHGSPGFIRLEAGGAVPSFCNDVEVTDNVDGVTTVALDELSGGFDEARARDGALHLFFEQSVDASTGDALRDEDGEPISIWSYDTDTGEMTRPDLSTFDTRTPGIIDVSSLLIDEGVVLRTRGGSPVEVWVRDEADIAGTIDVSGSAGGLLRFQTPGDQPLGGLGGEPGPGGGRGGAGGDVLVENDAAVFVDDGEDG